jgi:hypothetical protein
MGASGANQFIPIHSAMLLLGFVTLAIIGLVYRLWPTMNRSPLAAAQFWIIAIATLGIVIGSLRIVLTGSIIIAAIASAAYIVGAVLFAVIFWHEVKD